MTLKIGIDFDNTIVCYDEVFYGEALKKQLVPPGTARSKSGVKEYLCTRGNEDLWIELQGYVYGEKMSSARPFPGVFDFFTMGLKENIDIYIISHRTRYPYSGPHYDLHRSAFDWLDAQGFFKKNALAFSKEKVFFEETKENKLRRIMEAGCTHFIDDLLEFLSLSTFPNNVKRFLFAPVNDGGRRYNDAQIKTFTSWPEVSSYFGEL